MRIFINNFYFYNLKLIFYRNPTPETDDLIKTIWPPYTLDGEEYLDIGEDLVVRSRFEYLKIFHDLQMKYTGHI